MVLKTGSGHGNTSPPEDDNLQWSRFTSTIDPIPETRLVKPHLEKLVPYRYRLGIRNRKFSFSLPEIVRWQNLSRQAFGSFTYCSHKYHRKLNSSTIQHRSIIFGESCVGNLGTPSALLSHHLISRVTDATNITLQWFEIGQHWVLTWSGVSK